MFVCLYVCVSSAFVVQSVCLCVCNLFSVYMCVSSAFVVQSVCLCVCNLFSVYVC